MTDLRDERDARGNAAANRFELTSPRRLRLGADVAAIAGWVGLAIGWGVAAERTFFAYLGAFVYAVTIALGALALVMMAHAAGARWFVVVRRLAESVTITLPVFVLLFVPILFGLTWLYPWASLDRLEGAAREAVLLKQAWLNRPFFVTRSLFYLLSWSLLAWGLWSWSVRQDRRPEDAPLERAVAWSGPGLLFFGFTTTLAAIDWVMSLDASWASTVFGIYVTVGGVVAALALLLLLARALERSGPLAGAMAAPHYHALGRLLLTFVALWAYIAYSQGFLIWIADVPHEVEWYRARLAGGAGWIATAVVAGQFALPFAVLLSRSAKRSGRIMAALGVLLLAIHYLDVFWLILPALDGERARLHWIDPLALAAVVGSALRFGIWCIDGRAALPVHDPRLAAALRYESE